MPVVCLVRHGQASFGSHDYDVLSDAGREQSKVVGTELVRRGVRDPLVVSGSLSRQRDPPELVASVAGAGDELRVDERWDEYDHAGLVARYVTDADGGVGADSRAVQTLLDRALERWIGEGDAGGWTAFAAGAGAALDELVASLGRGRDAIVVTSGGVIAAVCGTLLGAPAEGVIALNRVMVNGSITTLLAGGSGISLSSFNDHSHFAGAQRSLLTYR